MHYIYSVDSSSLDCAATAAFFCCSWDNTILYACVIRDISFILYAPLVWASSTALKSTAVADTVLGACSCCCHRSCSCSCFSIVLSLARALYPDRDLDLALDIDLDIAALVLDSALCERETCQP